MRLFQFPGGLRSFLMWASNILAIGLLSASGNANRQKRKMLQHSQDFELPEKGSRWPGRTNMSPRNETFLKGLSEGECCDQ